MEEVYKSKFVTNRYKGGRPPIEFRVTSKYNYDRFCIENLKIKISFDQYRKAIYELNHQYVLYILQTGHSIKLPWGFGALTIRKRKGNYITNEYGHKIVHCGINWKETNKEGKKIYHFNEHTEGYRYTWSWNKYYSKLRLCNIWELKMCKVNKLLLTEFLRNQDVQYYLKYREQNPTI
jgi:hypothetical protein